MLDTEQQMAAAKQQMEDDLDADAELVGVKRKKKPAAAAATAAASGGGGAAAEGEEAAAAAAAAGDDELVRWLAVRPLLQFVVSALCQAALFAAWRR
jgi:hypothetical protein